MANRWASQTQTSVGAFLSGRPQICQVRFASFKLIRLTGKSSFYNLVAVLCIIVIIAAEPQISLFIIGVAYSLSGPLLSLRHKLVPAKSEEFIEKEEDATV